MTHRNMCVGAVAASLFASWSVADIIVVSDYNYGSAPSPAYPDSGSELTDGTWAGGINPSGPWVGWEGNAAVILFDLGASYILTSIDLVACNWTAAGVHLPAFVRFEFSSTPDFTGTPLEFTAPFAGSPADTAVLHTFAVGEAVRYVRVTADNDNQWLFIGEVTFNGTIPSPGAAVLLGLCALRRRGRR